MKIAIIGSRENIKRKKVEDYLDSILKKYKSLPFFISGGAPGVDTYVGDWCKKHLIYMEVIRPINPKEKLSYLFRNIEIITKAEKIIAFWDKKSRGTAFTIKYALSGNKDIVVIQPNGEVINNEKLRNLLRESTSF